MHAAGVAASYYTLIIKYNDDEIHFYVVLSLLQL